MAGHEAQLMAMVEQYPDATLAEYCEYCQESDPQGVSICTMCRELKKLQLTRKKTLHSSQAASERVQLLRRDYWERIKQIDPNLLVVLDEMGILLGLTPTHARRLKGTRVDDLKPFYRGAKVTVMGAVTVR